MLEGIKKVLGKKEENRDFPKHVAITTEGGSIYAKEKKLSDEEVNKLRMEVLEKTISLQPKYNIPIFTVSLLPKGVTEAENFSYFIDNLVIFFGKLNKEGIFNEKQIKVSIFGKWYDLPGRVVEPIKELIEKTKDHENFFLNFCINYDGQEEIVDACRLIAKMVELEKIGPESIKKETIKDNIYTSYFLPPDLIIKTGRGKKLDGFLLWDSVYSKVYFADRLWPEFDEKDFLKAVEYWRE